MNPDVLKRRRPAPPTPEEKKRAADASLVALARQVLSNAAARESLTAAKNAAQEEVRRLLAELEALKEPRRQGLLALKMAMREAEHDWIEVDGMVFTAKDDPESVHFEKAPYRPEVA
jgi:hypothetical protein